ncbi:D-alanine--D-alanine ligase [Pseudorhodobacter sp. MZDSW-24AT]|uniref:D-alanine--D-alanine ligase n=1 Tax=Pseudorhodobacter sp. MZDSW-24AT TaxID=2052957 RepID=UPI000C1E794A|nr:D-alanine--D-alanine ligase [Pseudorhodobacter sp. MZDSW-24AT]PJF08920.1 D-alanine--D-alanine ligase [Pseudorhodobacter sp. MZDSW-24AT]
MAGASGRVSRVAVIKGGPSAEREVSLSTGNACAKALREAGYEVVEVDAGPDLPARLTEIKPDVVFNALHGRWGEDGCVQGLLEWLRIPYTHSGVLASSLAMDKQRTKDVYRAAGLPVAESVIVAREVVEAGHVLPPPYVVKPNNEGSSVGVYIVRPGSNAPRLSAEMPAKVMVEAYAPGRELSISVMGDRALCVTDILTDGWYDYDAKYKPGGSRHEVPARIPAEVEAACLDYALRAHRALGCRGLSRTDIRWDEAKGVDGLILLETNTQPGMTPTSLSPEQAAHMGISFPALCAWIVEDASCNR